MSVAGSATRSRSNASTRRISPWPGRNTRTEPLSARKARVTGVVIVEAIIDERGNVVNARVLKGLPMGLDKAALDAVERWKFKPATLQSKPVKVYYTLTVNFTMQ